MNEEQTQPTASEVQTPDFAGEEMKMPENAGGQVIEQQKDSVINGPLLIGLTVLLIAILGGMYYWLQTMETTQPIPVTTPTERPTPEENNEPESTTAEAQTEALEVVSTSDEIEAIEADLESTDFTSLDAELDAIDAELDAALSEI